MNTKISIIDNLSKKARYIHIPIYRVILISFTKLFAISCFVSRAAVFLKNAYKLEKMFSTSRGHL